MKRVNEGMYVEDVNVYINNKPEIAEFRVFRVQDTPFWSYDCPKLNILARDVYEKKSEAIQAMQDAVKIGFKTVPVKALMLAIEPSTKK